MEVLHLLWNGAIGGAERAVYQLCRAQQKYSKFKPTMAYAKAGGFYGDQLRNAGIKVIELGMHRGRDVWALPAVRRALRAYPIHHFHGAEIIPMLASTCCRGTTRIYTHRGGASAYPPLKAWSYRLVGRILRVSFRGLSGNTQRACHSGARVLGVPETGWEVTYNGLDFSLLTPRVPRDVLAQRHGLPLNGTPVIGTSANLRGWKRIDLLLEACSRLKGQRFHLLIVGDGPDRARLEGLTSDLGLADRVVFTGLQEHVADYLALMDIFVLPSNSEESFGNSVVEAMAMGLPSIVFRDGGGLTEHIHDGSTGFIVGSPEELAIRIAQLLGDSESRAKMGKAASMAVQKKYNLEAMVARYDDLYKAAMHRATTG